MSARLFHDDLHPGNDYAAWLDETRASHPADIRIPDNGGDARITLIRAKGLAFLSEEVSGPNTFKLVTDAENSGDANPGAVADAMFRERARAADAGSHAEGASLTS
ncbi:MAG: hypothetical protein WCK77_24475 [Verrucomicrobiota bacterium]